MQLKYRAYIDGEFYYFDLLKLVWIAQIQAYADYYPVCKKIIDWLERGNQPDVFTGLQDKHKVDIYSNDITAGRPFPDGSRRKNHVKFINGKFTIPDINKDWGIEIIGTTHQNKDLLK